MVVELGYGGLGRSRGGRSRRSHRRYGKKKSRVSLKIPPTIYEVDDEGDPRYYLDEEEEENGDEGCGEGGGVATTTIVDLSILENDAEEVCRQRFSYRKSKKKHIDWDDSDSDSDSSAKSLDSLTVHTCQQKQKPKVLPKHSRFGNRRAKRQFPLAKVQATKRILDRIGSGSSFNSSEGPSDSSKHNMKVWEKAHHHQLGGKHKRSKGTTLKLLLKSIFGKI